MNPRILIVDDEKNSRLTIKASLHGLNYDLFFAENGHQALKDLPHIDPDLVLLDVMMPDMTGYEVCRKIRELSDHQEVPIVFITSLDDKQSLFHGFEAGGDDFITKPFNRIELLVRINGILRLNRFRKLLGERKRFQWLIDRADEGYISTDASFHILYANESAENLLSLPASSSNHPCHLLEITDKYFDRKPLPAWEKFINGSYPNEPLYLIRPETDQHPSLWLEITCISQPEDDHSFYQIKDVTSKVELTMEIKKFHNFVSHKLNTPMNHLLPFLELSLISLQDQNYDDVLEYVHCAKNGALELHQQVQRILQTLGSKNASSNLTLSMNEAKDLMMSVFDTHEIDHSQVTLSLHQDPQCVLPLSSQNFQSLFHEIIWNAVKNHPENSPNIDIQSFCNQETKETIILIRNNGTLLSPHELKSISHFSPYFQGEKYFTGQKEGMGLGLSGVKIMLWNIGGKFKIRNGSDEESVEVTISIPSCQKCQPAIEA
ncbi:Histidine kinase-, DNA gyrase B-, and HSP90-like ATPase [Tindallia magadiensis]|uniref:Stage 0 sporulation protein A homolog n=1 Tax=Tindallia magadiensis TaxID=69895 RepID=A0A1I3G9N3_9FIRM|nr:response regulator [Tindallia magadiensis]SFI20196.1 Histidine kinase-, DNA gyrase B-, and HSP90-like ATPase [Tindallia magadiensis]